MSLYLFHEHKAFENESNSLWFNVDASLTRVELWIEEGCKRPVILTLVA
jgi:hypothetical protein